MNDDEIKSLPVAYLRSISHPDWLEVCHADTPGAFPVFVQAGVVVSQIDSDALIRSAYEQGRRDGAKRAAEVCQSLWRIDGQGTANEFATEVRADAGLAT